jgi:HlyD family secretion protein
MSHPENTTQGSVHWHVAAIGAAGFLLVGGMGVLAASTDLSGAVIAVGSLVVESNVKKVQHPTGGIVADLLVRDGSKVNAGDLLVQLDDTTARANLSAVSNDLWELAARRARLEAERDDSKTVDFPKDLLETGRKDRAVDRIIVGERRLFELRRDANTGQKAQLHQRVGQLKEEIGGLSEQAAAKAKEIELVEKELVGVRQLWDKNLIQVNRLISLEREAARLKGERGALVAGTAQTRGKISETELQIIQIDQNLRSEVGRELADIRAKVSELVEKRVTALDQLQRIDIRAPQAGVVHSLAVHTKGGVIGAGEQIMLVVPETDALIAEVRIAPQDIDQVSSGQDVTLRFPNFNQRTTPELTGKVSRIAADTMQDQRTGNAYYLVRITLEEQELEKLQGAKLVPGMPVDAFIRTAHRSMLSYLLKPISDQAQKAFREK